ncbi:MAG: hypothetical protein Q8K60_01480, partial [Parachlamydiaceae bacterium]|nr:hypothetical protein [Parachlamydiaceae bacterium]
MKFQVVAMSLLPFLLQFSHGLRFSFFNSFGGLFFKAQGVFMRVCFVYKSDYPWDVRVEKLVQSIINNGHEVFLVCRNIDKKPLRETYEGIHMRRLFFFQSFNRQVYNFVTVPFYLNLFWLYYIIKCVK